MSSAPPPNIPGWNLDDLAGSKNVICILDADLRIIWANAAWDTFATDNGLPAAAAVTCAVGADYTAAIREPLRTFYREHLAQTLASDEPWSHDYHCSSPRRFRRFHQVVYPVDGAWLVVTNSLLVEHDHEDAMVAGDDYRDDAGLMHQCMHCRRVHNVQASRWDWVPDYVGRPQPQTSHGLCSHCHDFYYSLP